MSSPHQRLATWLAPFFAITLTLGLALVPGAPSQAQDWLKDVNCKPSNPKAPILTATVVKPVEGKPNPWDSLPKAIDNMVKALEHCGDTSKETIINLPEDGTDVVFPDQIGTKNVGTIQINGSSAMPSYDFQDQTIEVNTPLVLVGNRLSPNSPTGHFIANTHIWIVMSEINAANDNAAIFAQPTKPSHGLMYIGQSTIRRAKVFGSSTHNSPIRLAFNEFFFSEGQKGPFIDLGYTKDVLATVMIEENTFNAGKATDIGPIIRLGRSNATIKYSVFNATKGNDNIGIELVSPSAKDGWTETDKVENIEIMKNDFVIDRAISNDQKDGKGVSEFGYIKASLNDFSESREILPIASTVHDHTETFLPCNHWGDKDKRKNVKANKESLTTYLDSFHMSKPVECKKDDGGVIEEPGTTYSGMHRLEGASRVETAVATSQDAFAKPTAGVIIARSDIHADSVSAGPLAAAEGMPILLTQTDSLHPATAAEIKRLLPKGGRAYIMGGPAAISQDAEQAIEALTGSTRRIAGPNRIATAVATAEYLAKNHTIDKVMVTDGGDWQAALIAGATAAQHKGAVLLTWGNKMADETKAFLDSHSSLETVAIGDQAAKLPGMKTTFAEHDPTDLSMAVVKAYFTDPKVAGFATTANFADALTGGAHIATKGGPLILIGETTPYAVTDWVKNTKSLKGLVIYGGSKRITAAQEQDLTTALAH